MTVAEAIRELTEAIKEDGGSGSGGGADNFVIHISYDETTGYSVTETFDEIHSALEAGKNVYGIIVLEDTIHLKLNSYNNSEIKLSANTMMYDDVDDNRADAISIDYFTIKLDDVTGDTVVEFEQFFGELSDKPATIYLWKNLSDELNSSYYKIQDAVNDGKSVYYSVSDEYSRKILPLIGFHYDSTPGAEKYVAVFGGVDPDTSNISIVTAQASTGTARLVVS